MVGLETSKSRLTSPTVATPPLSRSTMPRRTGCASALKTSLAILLMIWTHREGEAMTAPRPGGATTTSTRPHKRRQPYDEAPHRDARGMAGGARRAAEGGEG